MKRGFIEDFYDRAKEVHKFFLFLKHLENGRIVKLRMGQHEYHSKVCLVEDSLLKTLKASSFLLLYNLVESAMRNSIQAISYEMIQKEIEFDKIRPELKKIVLRNLVRKLDRKDLQEISSRINSISVDIIEVAFDGSKLFSGNVDEKKIKEVAKKYGFCHQTDTRAHGGSDLSTVKNNRNLLAHGDETFAQVGQDRSIDELIQIKMRVCEYLKGILNNINDYLDNESYRNTNSTN